MLDQFVRGETNSLPAAVSGYTRAVRRHLAVVDQSRLRCDCLKLALAQQPRRWNVSDVSDAHELARMMRHGEEFDVVLLGGSTCSNINLADIALLAAAAPHTPILVAAECDDPQRAHLILRAGARGFLPTSHGLKIL